MCQKSQYSNVTSYACVKERFDRCAKENIRAAENVDSFLLYNEYKVRKSGSSLHLCISPESKTGRTDTEVQFLQLE